MSMETFAPDHLGSVLIVGGCGFVGFHLVRHFLSDPNCTSVSVISRNPQRNRLPGVSYHAGDISDLTEIRALLLQIRPAVIVHAASPSAIAASAKTFENVTVQGTRNLLTVAAESNSIKAFIFTSSATMAAGVEHIDLKETTKLASVSSNSHPYAKTKARADTLVLEANTALKEDGSGLCTACIRLPIVYGERDMVAIPGALNALQKRQTHYQIGPGSNQWDFVSAENAAAAHILLAKHLLARNPLAPKVDGEAFNITDGQRHLFWDFPRAIWKAAGHQIDPQQRIWVLPTWLALLVATLLEWLFAFFTWGRKRPKQLGRQQVEYTCFTHTYNIGKARERLGYVPVGDFEEGIRNAVAWSLKEDGWSQRLKAQ